MEETDGCVVISPCSFRPLAVLAHLSFRLTLLGSLPQGTIIINVRKMNASIHIAGTLCPACCISTVFRLSGIISSTLKPSLSSFTPVPFSRFLCGGRRGGGGEKKRKFEGLLLCEYSDGFRAALRHAKEVRLSSTREKGKERKG